MKNTILITILMFTLLLLGTLPTYSAAPIDKDNKQMKPPIAERKTQIMAYHGEKYEDPYAWLRDKTSENVLEHLKSENLWTDHWMESTTDFQKELYDEMVARIKEDDQSVPAKNGDYYYYNRMEKSRQYPIYCRKKGELNGSEEVILDVNELAINEKYFEIGLFRISPDHQILAYSTDTDGSEKFTIHFRNLDTGKNYPDEIHETYYSGEWSEDGRYFFYTILDSAMRPCRLMRHQFGTTSDQDVEVYFEKDEKFFVSISRSRDRKILFLDLSSQVTAEVRWLPSDKPLDQFKVILPRQYEVEYGVGHRQDEFYILTNYQAKNFRLLTLPVGETDVSKAKELIAHREDTLLEDFDLFADHLVLDLRCNGLSRIQVTRFSTGESHEIEFPEPTYSIESGQNSEFDSSSFRFVYESLVTPTTVYDYEMNNRVHTIKKVQEIPGGYDKTAWITERVIAQSHDGCTVPVSIVYPKELKRDGSSPFFLTSYGSYGMSSDPYFSTIRLSLLNRGFGFAVAHIRGGQEMGRHWYENGKRRKKKNTFEDFIACAEYLVKEKYTISEKLVINGGSAGGLLMGAVVNQKPEQFGCVIAEVPFVDVINTMMDPNLPLTMIEYDEWGDPNKIENFNYMRSYSPYDNIKKQTYPPMLVTAGLNDPRVGYWEPAKWVARMRHIREDNNVLLLKINMEEGHGGASGRYDFLKDIAFQYAFILKVLGVKNLH